MRVVMESVEVAMNARRYQMSDRYSYRAKRTDNGEWVYGHIAISYALAYIIQARSDGNFEWYNVDYSTVCQCTGLKNIFEKDIVRRTDLHKVGDASIGTIEYDTENTAYVIHWIDRPLYSPVYPWRDKIEVIGNIFDNPELLEVGE